MRSEERAGIVFLIMLLLWGTLVTEPFHILTRYFYKLLIILKDLLKLPDIAVPVILFIVFTLGFIGLKKLSRGDLVIYIPVAFSVFSVVIYIQRCISKTQIYARDAVALLITVVVLAVLYLLKLRPALVWCADLYIYSFPVSVICAALFVPIANYGETIRKILYITRYNEIDLTGSLAGVFGIPALVWGIFMFILIMLPVIYYFLPGHGGNREWNR